MFMPQCMGMQGGKAREGGEEPLKGQWQGDRIGGFHRGDLEKR